MLWLSMITRILQPYLERTATQYPVVTLTGPRQSGKTTLARMTFPDRPYVSLEGPSNRSFALEDPVRFLEQYPDGAILDEVQRAPDLISYIQGLVDEDPTPGRFLLTGSRNFALLDSVSQSLAGRTSILELLPLDLEEVRRFPEPVPTLDSLLWTGGYPRIHERGLDPSEWLGSYTAAYIERDVRSLVNVGDLEAFRTFLRLCAGRVGQLLNLSAIASDAGISQPTARRWLSVLEASFVVFRVTPFHASFGKRLIKTPKLYFYDLGLVTSLLGIEHFAQLVRHPLRGPIFESWVASEIVKQHRHRGKRPHLFFYRERGRLEIDFLLEQGADLVAIEAKAGATPSSSYFSAFPALEQRLSQRGDGRWRLARRIVLYGGEQSQDRSQGELVAWNDISAWNLLETAGRGA